MQKELLPQLEKCGPNAPGIVGKNFRNFQKWKMVPSQLSTDW
jgi:hypothetical protein